jgi:hypothetical protein
MFVCVNCRLSLSSPPACDSLRESCFVFTVVRVVCIHNEFYSTGKKTPGGAGTHTGHADTQRHTDRTDEPHNHPNPPTTHNPHVSATTDKLRPLAAADSRAAGPESTAPAADSEEATPSEPDPASTRSQSASPRLLEGGRRNSTGKKTPGGAGTHTGHTGHADAQRHTDQSHNSNC